MLGKQVKSEYHTVTWRVRSFIWLLVAVTHDGLPAFKLFKQYIKRRPYNEEFGAITYFGRQWRPSLYFNGLIDDVGFELGVRTGGHFLLPLSGSQGLHALSHTMTSGAGTHRFSRSSTALARDAKLLAREEAIADSRREKKRICPCNVCISGVRNILLRATVRKHLQWYGRHPYNRGSTEVSWTS